MTAPPTPLRDVAAAAAFLGVSESWLRHEVAARRVPHTRLGRRVLFTDANLDAIVEAAQVDPSASLASILHARRRGGPTAARR